MSTSSGSVEATADISALEAKAVHASVWTVLEYGSSMALRVVSSLVLTRLLQPAFFGEMVLVTTVMIGITLLSDVGLAPNVIQSRRGDDPLFLNTAWTIQVMRGTILWVFAILLGRPMAIFYHDPNLKLLIPVLGTITLISGFNSTNLLSLSRHMGVRRLFAIDGSTALVSLIVSIAWACIHPSVWALVGGQVVSNLYRLCLSHIQRIAPGIRNSFRWEEDSVQSIIHFGKWIMVGTAFFFFASQADRLVLGRLVSLSLLGLYGVAYNLADIPRAILASLSARVAHPFMSKMTHLPIPAFRAMYLRYRMFALLSGAFLLSVMVVWGNLLILRLYDRRYHEAAWMIPVLALGLWHTLLYQTTSPVLFALGKTRYSAFGNVCYCIWIFATIPIGFHFYGIVGAVIAIAAGDFPLYLANQIGAAREGLNPFRQDAQLTVVFLVFLLIFFSLRHLAG